MDAEGDRDVLRARFDFLERLLLLFLLLFSFFLLFFLRFFEAPWSREEAPWAVAPSPRAAAAGDEPLCV